MVNIVVPQRAHGWKLDRFLMDTYTTLSYSTIQKALRKKDIRINGKKVNSNTVIQAGDEITLYIPDQILNGTVDPTSPPSALPWLEVVYEDANLLIVNKKPGVSVHEDKLTRKGETLIEKATAYLTAKGEYHPAAGAFAPALCHRLDHYTGGIVIIAKTQPAYEIMLELIKNR